MSGIDVLILLAFVVYSIVSGFRNREIASESLEEYFLAGRTLRGWQAGISMAATQFAADTPLLVTGLVATGGIFALWRLWIYAIAFLMMGFLLAPSWRRARVLTDAELTELRYGSRAAAPLRGIKAIYFGVIFNCSVLAMVLLAATRIAEPFLHWDQWLPSAVFDPLRMATQWGGVPFTVTDVSSADVWIRSTNNLLSIGVIVLVTTFYSTTGGLRSVVATDIVQFGMAMLATLLFSIFVVDHVGGLSGIHAKLEASFSRGGAFSGMSIEQLLAFTPAHAKDASLAVLAVLGLQWLVQMNADGTGYLAQRSMACRSDGDAKVAAIVFTLAQVVLRSLLWIPLALGLLVLFPPDASLPKEGFAARREFTYVQGIAEVLPDGLKGLMLAGMLAALASTLDTHLNWGASYLSNDIYKRFICEGWKGRAPSPRSLVWVARGSNALILLLSLLLVPMLQSVQTAWQVSLLLGAGMGVLLVLRWLWWRINAWGELAAIACSLIVAPVLLLQFHGEEHEALRLLLMAAGSTSAGIIVSLVAGPDPQEKLAAFYERAHPPGFWGPVADKVAPDAARRSIAKLWRGLLTVVLASLSMFSLLVGFGSWLVDSPPPTWFPHSQAWILALLGLGFGLVPIWVRLAFFDSWAARAQHR
jgi:solute:Na+ symporter, SSS family